MQLNRNAILLWIWVVIATVGGIALVLLSKGLLPIVGVLGIILGLISLMPALMYTLEPASG
jgi:hypothetical protein